MTIYAEKNVAISGIGQSEIERKPKTLPFELAVRACERAIANAGLTPEDIDGAACWPHTPAGAVSGIGCASVPDIAASLGLQLDWWSTNSVAAQLSPITEAIAAIAAGYARHVLVWRAVGERSETAYAASWTSSATVPVGAFEYMLPYMAPSAANWIGCHASTHMHRYGITREQLGAVVLNQRRNAALNPKAIYREPLTMDDYLSARMVSTPFSILDCDIPCNGTTAFVISRLDAARDLAGKPIRIEAVGQGSRDRMETWISRADYPHQAMHDAGAAVWRRTDLTPKDLDTAHIYDGFSWLVLSWLEAVGICGEGESGDFVEGGRRIALDGELPMNTNGGQLSEGRVHGLGHLHEAVLQLRGEAGDRQVKKDVKVSIVANGGGDVGGVLLLRRDD